MRLVYLSPVPWNSFSQRPHKFVEWFHSRTKAPVLWVDPYPTRFPAVRDIHRLGRSSSGGTRASPPNWLSLIKPACLPIEPIPGSHWLNGLIWREQIRSVSDFINGGGAMIAIGKPSALAVELLRRFGDCPSLYDAMDDFPAFYSGLARDALARKEREIAHRVDSIFASSSVLESRWSAVHRDVRLVRNALDRCAIQAVGPVRSGSGQSIFGYVGTMASWFDWDWLHRLAESRPDDEIRLVGPVFDHPPRKLPSNVVTLPACGHAAALKAMSGFDVGLIPFKKSTLTASVDPIKYYEYRALGLPVISTDFGEMSLRAESRGVYISRSSDDVAALAQSALLFQEDAANALKFSAEHCWEMRFDAAMSHL